MYVYLDFSYLNIAKSPKTSPSPSSVNSKYSSKTNPYSTYGVYSDFTPGKLYITFTEPDLIKNNLLGTVPAFNKIV